MRFSDTNSFGYGTLTLKNGSRLNFVGMGSDGPAFPWKRLVVRNDPGNEMPNVLHVERRAPFAGDVEIAEGAEFLFIAKNNMPLWSGDFSASCGTLGLCGTTTSSGLHLGSNDLSNVSVKFYDGGGMVLRLDNDNLTEWTIGELSTDASITVPAENIKIFNLGDYSARRKTLIVGTKGTDSTFYGVIGRGGNEYLDFVKDGAGCLTLGAANLWKNNTTLRDGRIKLVAAGRLGGEGSTGDIVFEGGTLEYGDGVTTDYSSRIKSSTAFISVDTGTNEVTWTTQSLFNNNPDAKGIVKSGDGTLVLSGSNRDGTWKFFNDAAMTNRIDGGTLVVQNAKFNDRFTISSKILGSGTLKIASEEANGGVWLHGTDAFAEFTGTLDWANELNEASYASGLRMADHVNFEMPLAKLLVSGAPAEPTAIMKVETQWNADSAHVTVDSFEHPHANAQIYSERSAWTLNILGVSGDSYLNGAFTGQAVNIVKSGPRKLTLGPDFAALEGSAVSVNAGVFAMDAGMTESDIPSCVTIASGVAYTGEGVFGAVDLTAHDVVVPDASTFTDKEATYPLLTAVSFSGASANANALLATLNASEKGGKWKLGILRNGNGTSVLCIRYFKSGFTIVIR
jgi:hypothetical protein